MGNPGFRIHNAVGGVARIDVYSDIDPWWGVSGESFRRELEQVTAEQLEVHINSGGGDVHEGLAIMNSLRDHPAEVTVVVDGLAASAASFIAVGSGGRLVMHEASTLMIHDAWTFTGGDAAELQKTAATLDKLSDLIAGIYAAKSGTPVEEWRAAMREESWFTAEEAVLVGLADEVRRSAAPEPVSAGVRSRVLNSGSFKYSSRGEAPAPSILSRLGASASVNTPAGEEGETVGFLNDIAARLGVADAEVSESTVMAALEEALAEQAEDQVTVNVSGGAFSAEEVEKVIEEVTNDSNVIGEMKVKVNLALDDEETVDDVADTADGVGEDDLTVTVDKARLAELEADAELGRQLREEKERTAAAEAVEAAVNDGRLGAAARAQWTAKYLADPAGTADLLGSLPKGRINREETGHAHGDDPESTDSEETTAITNAFWRNR